MRKVLVTGAGCGLGLEFVKQNLKAGNQVFAAVHTPEKATSLHKLEKKYPETLRTVKLDLGEMSSIDSCYKEVKKHTKSLDVLINNAGINATSRGVEETKRKAKSSDLDSTGILEMIRVNAVAPAMIAQRFTDLLQAGESPRVINISSWLGSISAKRRGNYGHSTSKAALSMMGHAMASDLRDKGIVSLQFNPGWMQTDMSGKKAKPTPAESVGGILRTAEQATLEEAGSVLQWDGSAHSLVI